MHEFQFESATRRYTCVTQLGLTSNLVSQNLLARSATGVTDGSASERTLRNVLVNFLAGARRSDGGVKRRHAGRR